MDFRVPGFGNDALKAFRRSVATRAASLFPLGITARLTISLITVALLAAAANIIARDSVSIVRMVTRPPPPPPAAPNPSVAPQTAVDTAVPDAKRFTALTLAVDRYQRATQLRAGGASGKRGSDSA